MEKLWGLIEKLIPGGLAFGAPPEYDEFCLAFRQILPYLPAIDGFRIADRLYGYNEITQMRLDAQEVGEIEAQVSVEEDINETGRLLHIYKSKLHSKRRELVRSRMLELIASVDALLQDIKGIESPEDIEDSVLGSRLSSLEDYIDEMDILLGSDERPYRWSDLRRHMYFGSSVDLHDIVKYDWPIIRDKTVTVLYGQFDPIPTEVSDLSDIVTARPRGPVQLRINWKILSDEEFERLIYLLISDSPGYENPEWLQQTHAPDRGRDLSVTKVENDPLAGVRRYRTIIQCKHWLSKSVSPSDVGAARSQMELWHPPRVDILIIATTSRFTVDAVALVEQHNQSDRALHISMWPDSHLERLLAARPHLIAQFQLRQSG